MLGQRCDLFRTFVGAMQPVLSAARRMLLGVQPFNAAELDAEVERARADHLAHAAFASFDEPPPPGNAPGVMIEDLARAYSMLGRDMSLPTPKGFRPIAVDWNALASDTTAVPLSPFMPALRSVGTDLLYTGELVPLVLDAVEDGPFRVVIAVWAGAEGEEILDRSERLEALFGMWDGTFITAERWKSAHSVAHERAARQLTEMRERAEREERDALERQVDAAQRRLLGELARFLACGKEDREDFNAAFHRWMQRGGQTAALLTRAHGLVGYPEWNAGLVEAKVSEVSRLTTNQRKNVLLGTPLEAAVRDPRWSARDSRGARLTA